ncbi:hypothetical protein [Leisingera sp. JC11]|uniref:hypothetical protein n=1 Tax=Leisingera sp. JC11 TaxID=3042469 RepID=UPI003452F941
MARLFYCLRQESWSALNPDYQLLRLVSAMSMRRKCAVLHPAGNAGLPLNAEPNAAAGVLLFTFSRIAQHFRRMNYRKSGRTCCPNEQPHGKLCNSASFAWCRESHLEPCSSEGGLNQLLAQNMRVHVDGILLRGVGVIEKVVAQNVAFPLPGIGISDAIIRP